MLASVQDEVHQHQQTQVQAIQDSYQKQLQDLTEGFEQQVRHSHMWAHTQHRPGIDHMTGMSLQVLELQQQTNAQLADVQLAAEDALHQAAQAVLEELQLDSPVLHLPTATPGALWPTKAGSIAGSEVALELSLAALQQHADTGQPQHVAAACQQLVSTDVSQAQQQHGSSSRATSRSQKPCTAHAAPAAAQHKVPGDMRPSLDAPDIQWSLQHEDQVALDNMTSAAEQQDVHVPADWLQQQQQQQEQLPQPSISWHHRQAEHPAAQSVAQRAISPPAAAVMPTIGRSPSGSAAAGSPRAAAAATDSLQQAPWQRRPGRSSSGTSSQGPSLRAPAGAPTEQLAGYTRASLCQGAALATATPCPRMPPWQSLACHSQGAVQQGVLGRQLRTVMSLPARRQAAVPQPLTTRPVPATTAVEHAASVVLRRAPSLRQQLEAGWQQGLAKAAGKAADTSSTGVQLQAGVVRRGSLATTGVIINDSSSDDESSAHEGGSPGQQRRSLEVKLWSSLLHHGGAGGAPTRGRGDAGGASLVPAVKKPGAALARSSSA